MKPWLWRSLPLEQRSGAAVFTALFQGLPIATLLESPNTPPYPPQARYSICAGGPRMIDGQPQVWTPRVGGILPCLRGLLNHVTLPDFLPDLPFTGGWLGWLGYDLAWEIEQLPWLRSDGLPFPVAYWYEPECFAVLDHQQQILWLAASYPGQLDGLEYQLSVSVDLPVRGIIARNSGNLQLIFHRSQMAYEAAVRQAQRYIQAGDIFQANLSLRFEVQTRIDCWRLYQVLQQINPSPFACYWQTPWGAVVSCSPERLVQLQDRQAQTRPIAGTRSRGSTPDQDRQQAQDLETNAKEKAEHIMLVDLERNDLGRVAQLGSVKVNEFLTIESYSHVMHLVSNVIGFLAPEFDPVDLIKAMFPGGTITGCPKVRCLEIIEELEPVRRSLFYGSCGYLDQRGNLDLNILIRTLLVSSPQGGKASEDIAPARIWGQVGAGIVADSHPAQEWLESLAKAEAQLVALNHC